MGGLGFWELETFNMALLIKMADRIFKDPDSLWARVLKGVYYPHSDFVSGRKGGRSSWGWASICSARDTLLQERMWRVRVGKSICVFNDLWVYMKEGFKLEGRNSQPTHMMMKVRELFNADRTWNEELVLSVATPSDDHCVLQIPLPAREIEDQLIWQYTNERRVTTKSAYHIIKEVRDGRVACSYRNEDKIGSVWRFIWKTGMLPKVKSFMWSLLSDSLSVMQNLHKRGMNIQMSCPICGDIEDREHIVYRCGWTEVVWFGIMGIRAPQHVRPTIEEWIQDRKKRTMPDAEYKGGEMQADHVDLLVHMEG